MLQRRTNKLAQAGAKKYGLPRVGICGPLIEGQNAEKFSDIFNLQQECIRYEIIDSDGLRISWKARSEVPSRFHWRAFDSELDMHIGVLNQKLFRHMHDGCSGHCNVEVFQELCRNPF